MFRVTRVLFLTGFCALILSCTAEQPDVAASAPACEYKVNEHETPKFATYANDLGIPYDQEKLVEFMWVDLKQSECYAQQFAPVKIYRVPYAQNSGAFDNLPEAPKEVVSSWQSFEVSSGNNLKGLTTFRFEPGANEKILQSFVLVRADATSWHLWHEFSHFIIGSKRAHHHDQNLQIAEQTALENKKKELESFSNDENAFSAKIQDYFNNNQEFITKRYVDEIVIESTLIFLTSQYFGTPGIERADIQNSLNLIQYFSMELSFRTMESVNTVESLKTRHPLTKAQIDLLDMYRSRLETQKATVDAMIKDVSALASTSYFNF